MPQRFSNLLCVLLVSVSTAFAQGLYWEQTISIPAMNKEIRTKGFVKSMKLKSVSEEDGNGIVIRADKERIYIINHKEKTFSEMTFKEFEAQMAKMNEEMKKMQQQLKDLPPEQRKMMEGMMGGMLKEKDYTMKKTGEKKTVIGYACEKMLMMEGDEEAGEFWITKDLGSMEEYAKDWKNLMNKFAQGPMARMYRKLAELDGFMMESKFSNMKTSTVKLEKRSISDSEFEVPAGYKKVEMEKMGGPGGMKSGPGKEN